MSHRPARIALVVSLISLFAIPTVSHALTLGERLAGRILLQVQARGEAWYVDPQSKQRFYMGRENDAFQLMRSKGLGIRHAELTKFQASRFPSRLSGRILLDVERNGEAYYILPTTLKAISLGKPSDAYAAMRQYGLGITNENLVKIGIAPDTLTPLDMEHPVSDLDKLEVRTMLLINQYRRTKGLTDLTVSEEVAALARAHSEDMAAERVAFGHSGFNERAVAVQAAISATGVGENVAYNNFADPAQKAVDGWIASPGHRENIEDPQYKISAIGIAKTADGTYYFTQIFAN